MLVAKKPIEAGRVITAADIELRYVEQDKVRRLRTEVVEKPEHAIGMVASRAFRQDDILTYRGIRAPLLVRRGESVMAVARGGGIQVRTYAIARHDGVLGDLIEVQSAQSKEMY